MQKKYKNGWALDQTRLSSLATFMGIPGCVQGFFKNSECAGDEMIDLVAAGTLQASSMLPHLSYVLSWVLMD